MISIPGRIPITIYPLFWILIFLLGWLNSGTLPGTLIWAAVILFSVLIHEMGHALTAMSFGQKAAIEFVAFGGLTKRTGPTLSTLKEFIIVLNGPLAGFCLLIIAYSLQPYFRDDRFATISYMLSIAVLVNLFWTILNLMPVLPLDGGHLLRILLQGSFGLKGVKAAYITSITIASLLGIFFFINQSLFTGAIFMMLAFESYRALVEMKGVSEQDNNPDLLNILKFSHDDWRNGHFDEAINKLKFLQNRTKEGVLFVQGTFLLSRILADQGKIKEAYEELIPLSDQLNKNELQLLQQWAYSLQKWEQTLEVGNRAYELAPAGHVALTNALACANLGLTKETMGWLKCAKQFDLPNFTTTLTRREFDVIRNSPEFQFLLS